MSDLWLRSASVQCVRTVNLMLPSSGEKLLQHISEYLSVCLSHLTVIANLLAMSVLSFCLIFFVISSVFLHLFLSFYALPLPPLLFSNADYNPVSSLSVASWDCSSNWEWSVWVQWLVPTCPSSLSSHHSRYVNRILLWIITLVTVSVI